MTMANTIVNREIRAPNGAWLTRSHQANSQITRLYPSSTVMSTSKGDFKVSPEDAKLLEQRGGKFAQLLPGTTFPGTRVWNWWVPSGKLRELRKPWPMHFYDLPLNMVVFQNSNAMLVLLEAMD